MTADFLDAHQRHLTDAGILESESRYGNADHLYGLSAECGLKWLMTIFGMDVMADGTGRPAQKEDQVHINRLWDRYESYRSGHHQGAGFPLMSANPFMDWEVSQRYAKSGEFNAEKVAKHRQGVEQVRKLITKAKMDGLI